MSRREFRVQADKSHQFWAITLEGSQYTVQYGKVGNTGRKTTHRFASPEEANAAVQKQIAEKKSKGYTEWVEPAPPAEPVPQKLEVTHIIPNDPPDWLRTPEWKHQPQQRPQPRGFDRTNCILLVQQSKKTSLWSWGYSLHLPRTLTQEEARFWFRAMTQWDQQKEPADLARALEKEDYTREIPADELVEQTRESFQHHPSFFRTLVQLLTPEEVLDVLLHERLVKDNNWSMAFTLFEVYLEQVIPYLSESEFAHAQQMLRTHLAQHPTTALIPWSLAASFALFPELQAYVASQPDDAWAQSGHKKVYGPQLLVLNQGDPELVLHHFRRLQLVLRRGDQIAAWLCLTGTRGLDVVQHSILHPVGYDYKSTAKRMLEIFGKVRAPEVAPCVLELRLNSVAPALARTWLDENPGNAIVGLIPHAIGRGKLVDAIIEYLREAKRMGHAGFIEEHLQGASEEAIARIRRDVLDRAEKVYELIEEGKLPKEMRTTLASVKEGKTNEIPSWIRPTALPPLLLGDRRLSDQQLFTVLRALRRSPRLQAPHELVQAVKTHCDANSREDLAWRLFELWLEEGTPSGDKWTLLAVGHLGGDRSIMKLTPMIREWPGQSQHQRAVTGLECLRAIGTDTALMQLNGIAQKIRFQGLKRRAQNLMQEIAEEKGLTRDELEDRIIPDLDLDERGSRTFDFGSRQFRLVLSPDLAPMVRDETGKVRSDLPKPGTRDDAERANTAIQDWRLLKKQLRATVKVQAHRLEQAMITCRRWSVAQYESLLVRHPLMINLVRRLLWGAYNDKGKLLRSFRVTDEREYATIEDASCALNPSEQVGLVHPLHLNDKERADWGQVFGDYEIIAPFAQLGRPIQELKPEEKKASELTRFPDVKIPGVSLASTLENAGWTRYGGDQYSKAFANAGVTARVEFEPGLHSYSIIDSEDQQITRCVFLSRGDKGNKERVLGKVDPIVISEVLMDLSAVTAKGS